MKIIIRVTTFIFLLLTATVLKATIVLPRLISDGIVLQRNIQLPIWGWADVNEQVEVTLNGKKYTTKAGADRKWKILLAPEKSGGPFSMTITGINTIVIKNILIGDVWFCSGQSNMEYELYKSSEKYPAEIAASSNDQIRHFQVKRNIAFNTLPDIESEKGWEAANPSSILNWTAVGYFFAKNLFNKYHVPIGLINCSYGGTPAEAWMNEKTLSDFPVPFAKAIEYKDTNLVNSILKRDKLLTETWTKKINENDIGLKEKWQDVNYNAADWKKMDMPNYWQDQGLNEVDAGIVWFKKQINIPAAYIGKNALLRLGSIAQRDITYFNGVKVGVNNSKYPLRKYVLDSKLLKEGINTITVRILNESGKAGFIKDKPYLLELGDTVISLTGDWQYKLSAISTPLLREDNTRFQDQTSSMYHGMLEPLIGYGIKGVIWYQGESNVSRAKEYHTVFTRLISSWRNEWKQGEFPFLFVQLANINVPKKEPAESKLAELQEAQQLTLSLPNTGMAVANDIGEWNDVHPLNKADVGNRLALSAAKIAYGESAVVYSGPTYQSMKIAGNKIILEFSNVGTGLMTKDGGDLKYFSIAGANKKFVWAKATIAGNTITVWNDAISQPVAVRYAWADNPVGANLYNKEGLPASCFRTDR